MTTTDTIAALALVTAIVAVVGSWKAARNSDKAAKTMSRIEQQRLHTDLTPDFRCTIVANEACSTAMLRVHLEGPPGLLSHDSVEITVSIRNDSPHRGSGPQLAGGVPLETVRAHIWGPWKFSATAATTPAARLPRSSWRSASGLGSA